MNDNIILDYNIRDIGYSYLDASEIKSYNLNDGIVDNNGVLYIFNRKNIGESDTTHYKLAKYLKIKKYLRIAYFLKYNDGVICPDSISGYIRDFLLNEKMSIALYNLVNNKVDNDLTTFEEKLAKYGTDLGYYSINYFKVHQIYDYEMFNRNIRVLSYTLGKKFDRKFFIDILNN